MIRLHSNYATKSFDDAPHTRRPRAIRSGLEARRRTPEGSRTRIDLSEGRIGLLSLLALMSTNMKRRLPCS